jgi:hypothetical protein
LDLYKNGGDVSKRLMEEKDLFLIEEDLNNYETEEEKTLIKEVIERVRFGIKNEVDLIFLEAHLLKAKKRNRYK